MVRRARENFGRVQIIIVIIVNLTQCCEDLVKKDYPVVVTVAINTNTAKTSGDRQRLGRGICYTQGGPEFSLSP